MPRKWRPIKANLHYRQIWVYTNSIWVANILMFHNHLNNPGEHVLLVPGTVGQIEAVFTVPVNPHPTLGAILGHPHSLQGGTMNNKVVTTLVRACKELGIPTLRFNFRGVGQSAGQYDAGIGESEDMLLLAQQWLHEEMRHFIFAGFSFGSYVAYRAAAQLPHRLLISIAPPVHHYDYQEFSTVPSPWSIIQGDADEVVPADLVYQFAEQSNLPIHSFPATGHFFHGKLIELKEQLMMQIKKQVDGL